MKQIDAHLAKARTELWRGFFFGLIGILISFGLVYWASDYFHQYPTIVSILYIAAFLVAVLSFLTLCLTASLLHSYKSSK